VTFPDSGLGKQADHWTAHAHRNDVRHWGSGDKLAPGYCSWSVSHQEAPVGKAPGTNKGTDGGYGVGGEPTIPRLPVDVA